MKKFILFARVYTWLLAILPFANYAQDFPVYPNYVVIGAFEHKKNAVFFTDDANHHSFPARFEMNPNRNLYYVYVLTTDDREYAFSEALKLRTDTKYFDTWVYSGLLGDDALKTSGRQDLDINPATGEQIESITSRSRQEGDHPSRGQANAEGVATEHLATSRQGRGRTQEAKNPGTQNELTHNARSDGGTTENDQALPSPGLRDSGNPSLQESDQTVGSQINGRQAVTSNASGTRNDSKQNQVTIRRADGSSVVARTDTGSPDHQSTSDPAGNDQTQTEKGRDESKSRNEAGNALRVAGPEPKPDAPGGENERDAAGVLLNGDKRNNAAVLGPPPKQVTTEPLSPEEVIGKNFYFYLFRADNHDMVAGEVDAIDFEKSRRMATYQANTQVKVIMPSGKTKQISFLCQVFGYRKVQKEFDPATPAEDMYLDDKGNVVVPFELMRLQKGDIAIMYNVFFFKDAAVMRPESRYEVNNLLELLQENPSYKIKIHGHTNGNAPGKIIYMDKPGNFYSLSNTKQGGGSAKKLSEERALVIREYLISSGISADRMIVEAWGGKKPIHDKNSARAHENVRVEIEILSE